MAPLRGAGVVLPPVAGRAERVEGRSGASGSNWWRGRGLYLQLERCSGVEKAVSARLDEDKYERCAAALKDGVERYFGGQVEVEILCVPTLYAMEVRVMPQECHPRHGRRFIAKDAELAGGVTLFSKVVAKQWPKLDQLLAQVQDFCRVPVRFTLVGRIGPARAGANGSLPEEVRQAVNSGSGSPGEEPMVPLEGTKFTCTHVSGQEFRLCTDGEGRAESVLFPGLFALACEEGSACDRLEPSNVLVPARFARTEVAITATMKKQCGFLVVDHMGRTFAQFPLKLVPREPPSKPIVLRTKANGQCRTRLGRGIYVASYGGDATQDGGAGCPVRAFSQSIEVLDMDAPQFFRISVHRVRFVCEVMLRTRFDEPVRHCPFTLRLAEQQERAPSDAVLSSGSTSELGVATCDLPAGRFSLKLDTPEGSPFVPIQFNLEVGSDGNFAPLGYTALTKTVAVQLRLVTPDGEPAPDCLFHMAPQFPEGGDGGFLGKEVGLRTDDSGVAATPMSLLEPYVFKVKATGAGAEYMAQEFSFQTDRRRVTVVVARSIFGAIPENGVVMLIDASGSMQVYISDVREALNLTLVQQFRRSPKRFNIVCFTGARQMFCPGLIDSSDESIEDAMQFCGSMQAGGSGALFEAMQTVFRISGVEAVYLVSDGKCEANEDFLSRMRGLYFTSPLRPKVHVIGLNCVPRGHAHRGLLALSTLTQGHFRAVSLMQDHSASLTPYREPAHGDFPLRPEGLEAARANAAGMTTDEAEGEDFTTDADNGEPFFE